MGILVFWLSPCLQWIPLHTKCNKVLFVGSAISRSIWAKQIPLSCLVGHMLCCLNVGVSDEAGKGGIPKSEQHSMKVRIWT